MNNATAGFHSVADILIVASRREDVGITHVLDDGTAIFHSYRDLFADACRVLAGLQESYGPADKVILQFDDKYRFLVAYWACLLGGLIPVVMPPLPGEAEPSDVDRVKAILDLLDHPPVLGEAASLARLGAYPGAFGPAGSPMLTLDQLRRAAPSDRFQREGGDALALLMLTSGSTGMPKTVMLTQGNLLAAVAAKIAALSIGEGDVSFNWMDMSHVAGCVDFNLRDTAAQLMQVHAQTDHITRDFTNWLTVIDTFAVTLSFAPNFALGRIADAVGDSGTRRWNLSSLRCLIVGGEVIIPHTVRRFLAGLAEYGLQPGCFTPGFGMTETCAGSIFCHGLKVDGADGRHVSLGRPVSGLAMRVVDRQGASLTEGQIGALQLRGALVTPGYYRNPAANGDALAGDGWFVTGDAGFIDENGLTITGRYKDVVIVNGINYDCHQIEAEIEKLEGVAGSYAAIVAVTSETSDTEEFLIAFHAEGADDVAVVRRIAGFMSRKYGLAARCIIPLKKEKIPKTTLGKIQRDKLRYRYVNGRYADIIARLDAARAEARLTDHVAPRTETETRLAAIWSAVLKLPATEVSVVDNLFDLGATSLTIVALTTAINKAFGTGHSLQTVFLHPTIAACARFLDDPAAADDIVLVDLNQIKAQPKLFLVPPLLGEPIAFFELARHLDFPVLSFQARGLDGRTQPFASLAEAASVYISAMKAEQPAGPYHLGGYSYGAYVLAEMINQLERHGDVVAVAINLDGKLLAPDHFDMYHGGSPDHVPTTGQALAIVADTLQLFDIGIADYRDLDDVVARRQALSVALGALAESDQLDFVLDRTTPEKLADLQITRDKLAIYARIVAASIRNMADYAGLADFAAPMHVLHPAGDIGDDLETWRRHATGAIDFVPLPDCDHFSMMTQPGPIKRIAACLKRVLA